MAETRFEEDATAESVELQYEVELAGLNDSELGQVKEALSEAEFNGELDQIDVEAQIMDAQFAEEHREEAELAQRDQAEAVDAGDYDAASERAETVQEELNEAQQDGASLDEAVQENNADVEALSGADQAQDDAEYFMEESVDNGTGDVYDAEADVMDDYAADAADQADDYAQEADQGGYYGDQSIHTDNTV